VTTLYAAWKETARSRRQETALIDLADGRQWTFAQLESAGESRRAEGPVVHASGGGGDFIFDVLCAWREGRLLCPLDHGQAAPALATLPRGCVHLKTSSGSAGTPQLIAFTAAQLQADAKNIVATMGLRAEWPNLGAISLAHSYGFSNLVLPLLLHGIPLVLAPSRLPEVVRQGCARFTSLTLPGVPALWRVWHEGGGITGAIKLAISAGAALPGALETEVFERHGLKIHNFYGASECGGICYDASEVPRRREEEVGTPLQNVRLGSDTAGCLIVRSAAVGETYWPEEASALGGGEFQTSDRVDFDGEHVLMRGRRGDVINLAGQKVAPELIERALRRHPGVRDCVVFGVPEPQGARGEMVAACVSTREKIDAETLKKFLAQSIPVWQVPRQWWFVEELTEAERGKISRARWRERFLAEYKP
jgi:acyl-coenzyme A synthetase/AMP-(fatty) acid ligase